MSCPRIYLGTGRSALPLSANTANDSIVTASQSLSDGVLTTVQVIVYNHGTNDAPATNLQLYWTDPTAGFEALPSHLIWDYSFDTGIPGAITVPPAEGMIPHNFGWTPGADVLATNGGQVCLLVRLSNAVAPAGACLSQTYGVEPTVDPLSAVHCLQVVGSGGTGGGGGGGGIGGGGGAGAGIGGMAGVAGSDSEGDAGGEASSSAGSPDGGAGQKGGGAGVSGDTSKPIAGAGGGATTAGSAGTSSAGTTSAGGAASGAPENSGCGCRVGEEGFSASSLVVVGLAVLVQLTRRRRRSAAHWRKPPR